MNDKLSGLWPAMFTPVAEGGSPALDQVKALTELLISQKLDGLYILGSTGQGVLFTEEQRKEVAETVLQTAAGRVPVMVQVGSLTTDESVRLAQHAEKHGAAAVSSVGPIYFSGNTATALEHYRQIATSTALPFYPYQLGNNTMGDIPAFIDALLQIPNVRGMKLTTGQLLEISAIRLRAGDRLRLFSGADELMCHAALCGTDGAIGTFYNLWGEVCQQMLSDFKNGDVKRATGFMLDFQAVILHVLPNIWPFLRKAMLMKYNIDIGVTKAPLGLNQRDWDDKEVQEILDKIDGWLVADK